MFGDYKCGDCNSETGDCHHGDDNLINVNVAIDIW